MPALLPINPGGSVMKIVPLTQLQVAVKSTVDVFYFSMNVPMHVLFTEDGTMGELRQTVCRFTASLPPLPLSSLTPCHLLSLSFPPPPLLPRFPIFLSLSPFPPSFLFSSLPPSLSQIVRSSWRHGRRFHQVMKYREQWKI